MSAYATFFFEEELAPKAKNNISDKIITPECTKHQPHANDMSADSIANGWYNHHANHLFISILSASVNPMHLIQSFTRRSSKASHNIRERITSLSNSITGFNKQHMPQFSDDNDAWGEYSDKDLARNDDIFKHSTELDSSQMEAIHLTSSKSYSDMNNPCPSAESSSCHSVTSADEQEAAIEFNLSIAFNGRTYTATRALQSFIQLRNDLLEEYSKSRIRKDTKDIVSSGHHRIAFQQLRDKSLVTSNTPSHSHALEETNENETDDDEHDVVIPELPIGSSAVKSHGLEHGAIHMMGMVGNGFRGLQDAVFSYAPPMERWIRTVAALVPSSQALANFLWEPIDQLDQGFQSMKLQRVQTLNSIHECLDDESEDDES